MPGTGLTNFDFQLAGSVIFRIRGRGGGLFDVPFQFPPKITNETKTSNWDEQNIASFEPLKIYMGSGPRALTFEAEYIATDDPSIGDFTPSNIASILRSVKEYYYAASVSEQTRTAYPAVDLQIYQIVPELASFRMMDLSLSYGEQLVVESQANEFAPVDGTEAFPLYSKMTVRLELVTRGSFTDKEAKLETSPLKLMKEVWF